MSLKSIKLFRNGFSLIEVLVFVSILSLFFVAAMTVAVFSLRSMKTAQYKILATHLAEESVEWVKSQKDSSWTQFITYDTSGGLGTTYCLASLDWSSKFSCPDYTLGTPAIFKREILITNSGTPVSQVNTIITVSWSDTNKEESVVIKTVHSILE